jgi:deoxyribodipyrimidine photolyase-related protein
MSKLVIVLGDQLNKNISSLSDFNKESDQVLMAEIYQEAKYANHHKKKIAFLFSAMRHFNNELLEDEFPVYYHCYQNDDSISFESLIKELISFNKNINQLVITKPGEYRLVEEFKDISSRLKISLDIRQDKRFLSTENEFFNWASNRKELRMEFFYREMRKKYDVLMDKDHPIGGKWNYDSENRKFPSKKQDFPNVFKISSDPVTMDVLSLVEQEFPEHFGSLDNFHFATTRSEALLILDDFIENRLDNFGDFQDAMVENEPWMFHSHISFYLNSGLLMPLECIQKAEKAYFEKKCSLNSVEGFIRQILGWREYIRGIYWLKMPDYKNLNYLNAKRALPSFFWSGDTKLNCLHHCIDETYQNAYAHHIQRLMVLGNFLLLCGVNPDEVNHWYLSVYADAYEWVEMPNVTGMILYADGGVVASKPYASGGSYINKMSNYCSNCSYQVNEKNGDSACPFNYLFWDFLARNKDKLESNNRISMMYRTYEKMSDDKKKLITEDANKFLNSL